MDSSTHVRSYPIPIEYKCMPSITGVAQGGENSALSSYWGATSTGFVLLSCPIVSSDSCKCAFTSSGGVNASHCVLRIS